MSTGKRLAKRSILGTRIVAPSQDGRFYPAVIQAVKTYEDRLTENRYTVRFDNSRKVSEFLESDLIGPGFGGLGGGELLPGQRVYTTHLGREMEGTVMQHDRPADQVVVHLASGLQLTVRQEELRLLESRKSSRLSGQANTDFSKLADFNIVHERKRLNSEKSSDGSEFFGSRKRRGSETLSEEEERSSGDERRAGGVRRGRRPGGGLHRRKEGRRRGEEVERGQMFQTLRPGGRGSPIMTECTAAMVLMDLSGSPAGRVSHASGQSDASSGQMSPSSSGVSSLGTSWSCPSPTLTPPFPLPPTEDDPVAALLQLAHTGRETVGADTAAVVSTTIEAMESDEGIVSDQSNEFDDKKRMKTEHVQTIYQCTWPGCSVRKELCDDIESHVREKHLRRAAPTNREEDDHEEEFYYTEVDIPLQIYQPTNKAVCKKLELAPPSQEQAAAGPAAPLLSDHMDMARPAHENPEYGGQTVLAAQPSPSFATIISPGTIQWGAAEQGEGCPGVQPVHAVPIAIPITTFTIATSQQGLQSPGKYIRLSPKPYTTSPKSPLRRPRGDAKKCRKVYGMEHRELWCTQCKWKKACTRFGENERM